MSALPPESPALPPPVPPEGAGIGVRDQAAADASHLKLLMVFHYVLAGLSLLGLGFLFLHYTFMDLLMNNPEMWEESDQRPPPEAFFDLFQYFYLLMGLMMVTVALANALSARFIQTRRHRIFSMVVAGLDCLLFPFGTALGIFTFIVLLRDSVESTYAAPAVPRAE